MGEPQTRLEWALDHAKRGWPVFPLHSVRNGHCSCNNPQCSKHSGKHPRTQNGFKNATTDEAQIREWWGRWPDANIGIPTGRDTFISIDKDPRHGGDESLAELIVQHGPLPDTVGKITGGGGEQKYFQHPGGEVPSRTNLAGMPGLDVKGDGGYVVAVGSITQQAYTWEASGHPDDVEIAPMPEWLQQLVVNRHRSAPSDGGKDSGQPVRVLTEAENERAVELLVRNCAFIGQHCVENASTLPRDHWWLMTRTFGCFGSIGAQRAHEYSQPYPGYSERETNYYLADGLKSQERGYGPHSCSYIEEKLGFPCPADCQAKAMGARAPAGMASKLVLTFSDDGRLPQVVVSNRQLRDVSDDALAALDEANEPECIFVRGGSLVRISKDERDMPYIQHLGESAFRGHLARVCNFFKVKPQKEDEIKRIAVPPPLDVVRDCLSLGSWGFPPLIGITETPVMRPDGSILTQPGYDRATHLFYMPAKGLSMPEIPENPSKRDVDEATSYIKDVICDFPFDGDSSKANALAAIITPILRPMIEGSAPLIIFDKPQYGTGASLLAEAVAVIATGRRAAMMTAKKDDDEWRKAITSTLLQGATVITIDNIENELTAASLGTVLTATTWKDRLLGRNEEVILPNKATWIATGNNLRLRGDLPRRTIWVRMDAKQPRPWLRDPSGFKHPQLVRWVQENRGMILAAILTIARGWVVDRSFQPPTLPILGGFEDWVRKVGGVLSYAGITGFLGNLESLYDELDTETPQWDHFLEAWADFLGDQGVTAADLVNKLNDCEELRGALPDDIADIESKNFIRRLGNALAKKKGVRFPGGCYITKVGQFRRATKWCCVSPEKADSHGFSRECESGESVSNPSRRENEEEKLYINGGERDSQDSHLASKGCESCEDDLPKPTDPCHACGSMTWWLKPDGEWGCETCHPQPSRKDGRH